MTNKHVDIKLRLRLFESVITPSALYGLTTAPLAAKDYEKAAVAQRKMLRLMFGYVKLPHDAWQDMYRKLRQRIERATAKFPLRLWHLEIACRKRPLEQKLQLRKRSA